MLTLILEHPTEGTIAPYVTGGTLDYQLDRYPRWSLQASLRPDPDAVFLWQSPYGTRARIIRPDGSLMFTGPVIESSISRPDGAWTITASDDIVRLRQFRTSNRPGQFLPGTTMTVADFIRSLASLAGATVVVTGDGGLVDVRGLDIAGAEAWSLVEEQLIANNLDCWPQGDGSLLIGPTASLKDPPDHSITVGESGTLVSYSLTMSRIFNRVLLTHEASKDGEAETRYVDGIWTDSTSSAGTQNVGINPYTRTVRVGADWWDDPAGHQAQADASAASIAQTIRGFARQAVIEIVPNFDIAVGQTVLVTFLSGTTDKFLIAGAAWPLAVDGTASLDIRNPDPDWPGSTFFKREEAAHARQHA